MEIPKKYNNNNNKTYCAVVCMQVYPRLQKRNCFRDTSFHQDAVFTCLCTLLLCFCRPLTSLYLFSLLKSNNNNTYRPPTHPSTVYSRLIYPKTSQTRLNRWKACRLEGQSKVKIVYRVFGEQTIFKNSSGIVELFVHYRYY